MLQGIRRELDARRQSKAVEGSIKAHKETMRGLQKANQRVLNERWERNYPGIPQVVEY